MNKQTHTPGPWSVNPTGDIGPWHVGSYEYGPVCDCTDTITGDLVANARLIAAAPEMYEALEALLYEHKPCGGELWHKDNEICECERCDRIRFVLAKARGEAL